MTRVKSRNFARPKLPGIRTSIWIPSIVEERCLRTVIAAVHVRPDDRQFGYKFHQCHDSACIFHDQIASAYQYVRDQSPTRIVTIHLVATERRMPGIVVVESRWLRCAFNPLNNGIAWGEEGGGRRRGKSRTGSWPPDEAVRNVNWN